MYSQYSLRTFYDIPVTLTVYWLVDSCIRDPLECASYLFVYCLFTSTLSFTCWSCVYLKVTPLAQTTRYITQEHDS